MVAVTYLSVPSPLKHVRKYGDHFRLFHNIQKARRHLAGLNSTNNGHTNMVKEEH